MSEDQLLQEGPWAVETRPYWRWIGADAVVTVPTPAGEHPETAAEVVRVASGCVQHMRAVTILRGAVVYTLRVPAGWGPVHSGFLCVERGMPAVLGWLEAVTRVAYLRGLVRS